MTEHGSAAAIELMPVTGLPEFRPGDDLVAALVTAAPWLREVTALKSLRPQRNCIA